MAQSVPLLISLVLLTWLSAVTGQLPEPPEPDEEKNFCMWLGQWHAPDPMPIFVSAPCCLAVSCVLRGGIARINSTIVGGESATNCCEFDGHLYTQGEIEYHGGCENHICNATGWQLHSTLTPGDEVPCPPGSVAVWTGNQRRCVTVFPITTTFSAASAHCRQLGGALARPFGGRRGRRDDALRAAIGDVPGWLGARGGNRAPNWPSRFHPARLWFNSSPVLPRDAVGCLGYKFTSTSSAGGWFEYQCSEQLQPICAVIPPASCTESRCWVDGSYREHGTALSQPAPCLTIRCWHGHRMLEQDPSCCKMTEEMGDTTKITLLPTGNHLIDEQICICESGELTCSERLCTETDSSP